jgi:hypothetical protein
MTFLIDLSDVPEDCCNHHLDLMAKAASEQLQGESIWKPHENPVIRSLVEDISRRFQTILEGLQDAFARLLIGESIIDLKKADAPWMRWDAAEFDRTVLYLEAKPPADYTLDDWMLAVDLLLQRYLGPSIIKTEAEYLTVRASMLGKISANAGRVKGGLARVDEVVDLVPTSFAAVPPRVLTAVERATLEVAKARAAENITGLSENLRHSMKGLIIEHIQAQVLGQKDGQAKHLRTRLFDSFGILNRDFRRIAVTEAGECCNQGFILAQEPKSKVKRKEAYTGACRFCRSIDNEIFEVVAADAPDKDGQTQIWPGKTNIGRHAAPMMREAGKLVERSADDLWWPAAGVQHPHCRGSWLPESEKPPAVSQEFEDWLQALVRRKETDAET